MGLILVGLNHKTAPLEVREQIAFREDHLPHALRSLTLEFGFQEGMILCTCNRVEILARPVPSTPAVEQIKSFLSAHHRIESAALEGHLYTHSRGDLVRHVFRVASSLDSMVVGEPQVLGQLKRAFALAQEAGSTGRSLNRLIPRAFYVAKRVRKETRVGASAVSVSFVAVELARKIFGSLTGKSTLLVGAGKMSELSARNLVRSGVSRVYIANRTAERSEEMSRRVGGVPVPFEELDSYLVQADIVIVSTGSSSFVLDHTALEEAIRRRRNNPIFVIDISVPRNVDPRANEIENVFLFDIDDLQSVVDENYEERKREADVAENIINTEVRRFLNKSEPLESGPVLGQIRRRIEEICLLELEKSRSEVSEDEFRRLRKAILKTAHRIAHPLIVEVKRRHSRAAENEELLRILKDVLRLEEKK